MSPYDDFERWNRDHNSDKNLKGFFIVAGLIIVIVLIMVALCGCASIPEGERGYTIQSHTTLFGLDLVLMDYLAPGLMTPHVRLGYITHDTQVTPEGSASTQKKTYTDILGDNKITSEQGAK